MSEENLRCCRIRVSGRVQGVGFRMATWHLAQRLGVTGYAENLRNGDVEVLACGDADAVAELLSWLGEGPPAASVTEVAHEDIAKPEDIGTGFETR